MNLHMTGLLSSKLFKGAKQSPYDSAKGGFRV